MSVVSKQYVPAHSEDISMPGGDREHLEGCYKYAVDYAVSLESGWVRDAAFGDEDDAKNHFRENVEVHSNMAWRFVVIADGEQP